MTTSPKTTIVTGASRGLCLARAARALAQRGRRLVVDARTETDP